MRRAFITILLLLYVYYSDSQSTNYDSLKNLISSAKDDSTRFTTTSGLIWDYVYSNPDSALKYIRENILLAFKMKSDSNLAQAYAQYAALEHVNGNYPMALQYQLQSLRAAERTHDYFWICAVRSGLGDIYKEAGDFDNAIYNLKKAKSLLELHQNRDSKNDDKWGMIYMNIYLGIAQIYERFDHLDSALNYGNNAYDGYVKVMGKMDWAPLFYTMGNIYSKKGNYLVALSNYRKGVSAASRVGGNKDIMDCYSGIASTFKRIGQLDSCIFYANKALELSQVAHNLSAKLDVLDLLSDVYKLKHNTDSVAKYLEQTIETKDSLFNAKKVMETQTITFNEQLREQEIRDQQEQYRNRLRTYLLAGGLLVVLLLAGILYRNNLQKQKAKIRIEKAYEALKTAQAQLIQSEKMASLGELTAGIAHEIQNPLNFVNNFSEVNKEMLEELKTERLKPSAERDEQTQDDIINDLIGNEEKINHHGKRADSIVKGMLQHSRSNSGVKEPTDINILADEWLRLAYNGIRAKDKLFNAIMRTDFDKSIGKMNVIPQDIGRVLLNLYNNAFYALSAKALAKADGSYEPTVSVSTRKVGGMVLISVRDNGPGIPQKIVGKIFQPFFTTKPTGQGTGLGLSLVYDIVKAHGGEIKVESKEEEACEFIIQLPV